MGLGKRSGKPTLNVCTCMQPFDCFCMCPTHTISHEIQFNTLHPDDNIACNVVLLFRILTVTIIDRDRP